MNGRLQAGERGVKRGEILRCAWFRVSGFEFRVTLLRNAHES